MKKRLFFLSVLALFLHLHTWAYSLAVENEDGVTIYYNVSGTNLTVTYKDTQYNSYSGTVKIPETVIDGDNTYTVTSIGTYAFRSCENPLKVIIPNTVTSIESYAFYSCEGLTDLSIGCNVTSIGTYAVAGCTNLEEVIIPESVTSIGTYAFHLCSNLTSLTITKNVTTIGEQAFRACSSLTSVVVPDGVTSIERYLFYDCTNLTELSLGKNVTTIGENAIRACSSLTDVTIPSMVTSIGNYAYYQCSALESITSLTSDPPTCGTDVFFHNKTSDIPVYVPKGAENSYAEADTWENFTNIQGDVIVQTRPVTEYTFDSALLEGYITAGTATITDKWLECWILGSPAKTTIPMTTGDFSTTLDNLTQGTTYTYQACAADDDGNTYYGKEVTFTIPIVPTITTQTPEDITYDAAKLLGSIQVGSEKILEAGFEYWTNGDEDNKKIAWVYDVDMSAKLTDLSEATTYTYRAYAVTLGGKTYSAESTFSTMFPPTITTDAATNITYSSATLNATVEQGSEEILEKGFLYWTDNPDDVVTLVVESDDFTYTLEDLPQGTLYTYKAFVITERNTFYGESVEFATITLPTITTTEATDVTYNSATLNAILEQGSEEILQKGFVYWTDNPDEVQIHVVEGDEFTYTLDDLIPETTYTYCAFVITESDTFYGEHVEFTTLIQAPTIKTLEATNITESSATLNAIVEAGSEEILQKGFVYWMDNPNDVAVIVIDSDDMAYMIEDLTPQTTYTYCAFVTTESGTLYGEHVEFTTHEEEAKAETHEADDITEHTAILTAEIEGDVDEVIQKGFVYWTDDPNKANIVIVDGDEFTYTLTNLTAGTLYTYCAFIITENGTTYGEHVEFTTLIEAPTLETLEATDVTDEEATLNAKLEVGSEEILQKGFVYWMDDPNDVTTLVVEGDEFTYTLGDLTSQTTYTYCAFVITESDTYYGETIEFTTITSGINSILSEIGDDVQIYTLSGTRVNTPQKGGIYILKYSDGTSKKVVVK